MTPNEVIGYTKSQFTTNRYWFIQKNFPSFHFHMTQNPTVVKGEIIIITIIEKYPVIVYTMSDTNNRFLQSNLQTNDIATESTLRSLKGVFDDPLTVTGTVDVQTAGLTDKVQVAIDEADITGSLPISLSSVTITDFDFSGGQTSVVNSSLSNVEYADTDAYTSATSQGLLMMAVDDEKVSDETVAIKYDGTNNGLKTSLQNFGVTQNEIDDSTDNLMPIAVTKRAVPSRGIPSNLNGFTVPSVNNMGKLWVSSDGTLFTSKFRSDTQTEYWSYSGDYSESFNAASRSVDITIPANTPGATIMRTNDEYEWSGKEATLYITVDPNFADAGQTANEIIQCGMRSSDVSNFWGFSTTINGIGEVVLEVNAGSQVNIATQSQWNISQIFKNNIARALTLYWDLNEDAIVFGEIYEGSKHPFHRFNIYTEIVGNHFTCEKIFIRVEAGNSFDAYTPKIYSARLIQDDGRPIDKPFQNNYENMYLRTKRNDGTPLRLSGGAESVGSTNFKQLAFGLITQEFYDLPSNGVGQNLQISCDNNSRTTQVIRVLAWTTAGTIVEAQPTLNGQTAVNLSFTNSSLVYRIIDMEVLVSTMGTNGQGVGSTNGVYLSPQGTALTAGKPNSDIWASMALGLGKSMLGQIWIPPSRTWVPNILAGTANKANGRSVHYVIQGKPSNSELWTSFEDTGFLNNWNTSLSGWLPFEGGDNGYDIRIIVAQGDGSGSIDECVINIHGTLY